MRFSNRTLPRHLEVAARRNAASLALALLLAILVACGGGGDGGVGGGGGGINPPPGYRPFFPDNFEGVISAPTTGRPLIVTLAFVTRNVSADGTTGELDAATNISLADYSSGQAVTSSASLSGTFSQRTFTLTVTPNANSTFPFPAQYQGNFEDDNTLRLTPTAGGTPITVRRNNLTFFPSLTGNWSGQSSSGQPWLIQLRTEPPFSAEEDATVLLSGTEVLGGQFSKITGYANVRTIVLDVQRPGGTIQIVGGLTASSGRFTTNVQLGTGPSLTRGGIPDQANAIFLSGAQTQSLMNAPLGGQPSSTVVANTWDPSSPAVLALSPDRQRLAIAAITSSGQYELKIYSFATHAATTVLPTDTFAYISEIAWAPDNQSLAFLATRTVTSPTNVYLVTSIANAPQWRTLSNTVGVNSSLESLAWAPTGQTLSFLANISGYKDLYVQVNPATDTWAPTSVTAVLNPARNGFGVWEYRWAPSGGELIALSANTVTAANPSLRQNDVYVVRRDGTFPRMMNTLADISYQPTFAWAPNATHLAFGSRGQRNGSDFYGLFLRPVDASSTATYLTDTVPQTPLEWNPAGTALLLQVARPASSERAWAVIQATGIGLIELSEAGSQCENHAHWSTDGSWIGYTRVIRSVFGYTCRLDAVRANATGLQALSAEMNNTSAFQWIDGNRVIFQSEQDVLQPEFFPFDTELFVTQAGGSGTLKLSSAPLDRQPVAMGWVLRRP